tara:strand:+ start:2764 stop:3564 length:801 start_codon:yes stop_codon:yes gene_type:complete
MNKIVNVDCIEGLNQLEDNSVDLCVTSPPYNVGIEYDSWDDTLPIEKYYKFTKKWISETYRVLKDDGRIAINIPYEINAKKSGDGRIFLVGEYQQIMKEVGYGFAGIVDLTEDQPHRVKLTAWGSWLSPSAPYIYNPKECIILGYKNQWNKIDKGKSYFEETPESKKEFQDLVYAQWKYRAETRKLTEANFSLDIPNKALKILSYEDDLILDPFMGSGTTAISCINLNRRYIGFEISKSYYDISIKRVNKTIRNNLTSKKSEEFWI